MRLLSRWQMNMAAACLLAAPVALRAGDGIPVPADNAPAEAAALLGQEYKDEANGFRLQVPFGVRIFQRSGLELVSFVHDTRQWAGNVQLATLEKDMNVPELLRSRAGNLGKVFKAVQILESRETIISGKPAGKLVSALQADYPVEVGKDGRAIRTQSVPLLRQELMVQTATNQYMIMTFFAPQAQKDEALRVFNAMVGTFELLDRKAIEARRLAAVNVGKAWLAGIHAEDLAPRLVHQPQLFRIRIENRDVGYVRFDEAADVTKDGFKGVTITANSRTFPADGSMILGSNEAFWAYHNQGGKLGELPSYSTWNNAVGTRVPPDPNHPAVPAQRPREIRPGQVLHGVLEAPHGGVVKWTEQIGTLQMSLHPDASNPQNIQLRPRYDLSVRALADTEDVLNPAHNEPLHWVITPELPAPLPKALEYLWPRLVDLRKETQLALVVFNPGPNKLALRTLGVGPAETITVDGVPQHLTRLTDELGASSTTLWVDEKGIIKMMRTSDGSVLLPTTEEQMQQLWAATLAKFR